MKDILKLAALFAATFVLDYLFESQDAKIKFIFFSVVGIAYTLDSKMRHLENEVISMKDDISEIKEGIEEIKTRLLWIEK